MASICAQSLRENSIALTIQTDCGHGSAHSVLKPSDILMPDMVDITRILEQIEHGNSSSADQLLPLVYDQLRRLAEIRLRREKPGQTLQATALVHDAYLQLVDVDKAQHWDSRGHFFAAAAESMRRILVQKARQKQSKKRGGDWNRQDLDSAEAVARASADEVLAIHESLDRLEEVDVAAAQLVKLRYFAGMTIPEAAEALAISPRKANQLWTYARTWLLRDMSDPG